MSNLEARLARLEQQFSTLLANDNTRPALRSATAVPLKDAAVAYSKLASAAVSSIQTNTQKAAETANTPVSGANLVVAGFGGIDLSGGAITIAAAPYQWVYAYGVYSAAPASVLSIGLMQPGVVAILSKFWSSADITFVDGTALRLAGNCTITTKYDTITLVSQGGDGWVEVARSVNG